MIDILRDLGGYLWSVVLLGIGAGAAGWRQLSGRVRRLEIDTMPKGGIDEKLAQLEKRLDDKIDQSLTAIKGQHADLRTEIHRIAKEQSIGNQRIYERMDALRNELKNDFKDLFRMHRDRS